MLKRWLDAASIRLAGYSVRVRLRRDRCEIGTRWTIRGFHERNPGILGFRGFWVGGGGVSSGQYGGLKRSQKVLPCYHFITPVLTLGEPGQAAGGLTK